MSGATNRRRGVVHEQQLARWLRERGIPHAECAPRGGHQADGDILGWPEMFVEAKATRELRLSEWLDKARHLAGPHRTPLLVVKRRGHADPGESYAVLRLRDLLALLEPHQPPHRQPTGRDHA